MKYARVEWNIVQQVTDQDPVLQFGQAYGVMFVICPDDVEMGWLFDPGTNTYSAPPPPPLQLWEFEDAYDARVRARKKAVRDAHFITTMQQSPNYPLLPSSLSDYETILNGVTDWPE